VSWNESPSGMLSAVYVGPLHRAGILVSTPCQGSKRDFYITDFSNRDVKTLTGHLRIYLRKSQDSLDCHLGLVSSLSFRAF
jgi:hypothetical protein